MNDILLILTLYAGAIFQAAGYLKTKSDYITGATMLGVSLFGLLPGKNETSYDLGMHLLGCAVFFSAGFGFLFRSKILQIISERTLLEYTLLLSYTAFVQLPEAGEYREAIVYSLSVPLVFTTALAVTPWRPHRFIKLAMYVWFIVMNVAFLFQQYSFEVISGIFSGPLSLTSFPYAFGTGMALFHLVINVFYLLALIPIPGKRQSWRERMQDLKEHIDDLVAKVDESQLRLTTTALICMLLGGLLYLNARYEVIEHWIVMNGALVIFSYSLFEKRGMEEKVIGER